MQGGVDWRCMGFVLHFTPTFENQLIHVPRFANSSVIWVYYINTCKMF